MSRQTHANFGIWVLCAVLGACGGSPASPSASVPTQSRPTPATFTLRGIVRDAGNDNLIAGAIVQLTANGTSLTAETAFEGAFSFIGLPAGSVIVSVATPRYTSQSQTVDVAVGTPLDFRLERAAGRSVRCGDAPDTGNRVLPLFSRPFAGDFRLVNYFDHDLPLPVTSASGTEVNSCDERIAGKVDGHAGYDWSLPVGTPLVAVAEGEVIFAGAATPFFCSWLGRTVSDQQLVQIRHPPMNGEQFVSSYVHLSQIDVTLGQQVSRGQAIGASGNTGCSTGPHLHFGAVRLTNTNNGRGTVVDPYGWEGVGRDPWRQDPSGAGSVWLWRPGEAPALRP